MRIELRSVSDTLALGRALGRAARPGDVITLHGDLGAGKTTLAQAIGAGAGVPADCHITSPTFAIMHQYDGRLPLYHMDLYRVGSDDFHDLGLEEYLYGDGLCVIEWPERLVEPPEDRLDINLTFVSETARQAEIVPHGTWHTRDIETLRPTPRTAPQGRQEA